MKKTTRLAASALAGLLILSVPSVSARAAAPQTSTPNSTGHSWTMEQAVTSSVREAWALGGKTEDGFFEIVQALTELSAQKRGVTLTDTKEAGTKAGNWIKKQAKKDPDQLLYVIVDRAVQFSSTHPSAGASQ